MDLTLRELLDIYLMEIKMQIVESWSEFKDAHLNKLRHIDSYTHGMLIVNGMI